MEKQAIEINFSSLSLPLFYKSVLEKKKRKKPPNINKEIINYQ